MPKRILQLDAVRGIAVLLVVLHNTAGKSPIPLIRPLIESGWMGVDLFFVLSGFLITGILLETRDSQAYFTNFYARRCLRIWPLYYSLLFCLFVVLPWVQPSESALIFGPRSSPWWAYPLFLQNFLVADPAGALGLLGVTWSLAVEEQFYLAWPWVVRYCSARQLRRITVLVICLSPLLRLYLSRHGVDTYSNLFCRLDGLMGGGLLAVAVRSENFRASRYTRAAWVAFLVAAPLAVLADLPGNRWFVHSLAAIAALSLVYLALFSEPGWFQAAMKNRFLIATGTISYGIYLFHKIPFDLAKAEHLAGNPLFVTPAVFAIAFLLAALSWNLLEKPFLRLKKWFVAAERSCEPETRELEAPYLGDPGMPVAGTGLHRSA
ncbi:MAG TPA: acyltransferase [Bryobacteraceae bacterium]|nr:acyltransferase [Bryobacteraceae bacterium]